jgi:hypothetical protein
MKQNIHLPDLCTVGTQESLPCSQTSPPQPQALRSNRHHVKNTKTFTNHTKIHEVETPGPAGKTATVTWLDDVAVGEDDAAGLVDDEPRCVAGAGDLSIEGARRGGADDDDGRNDEGESAAPVIRRDAGLDLHRQLAAGLLLRRAFHRSPDPIWPPNRRRPITLGFWGCSDFCGHAADVVRVVG